MESHSHGKKDTQHFSVSSSSKAAVVDYIEHQAEHHRGRSYEVEFETMIRKSGMRFEPEEAFG